MTRSGRIVARALAVAGVLAGGYAALAVNDPGLEQSIERPASEQGRLVRSAIPDDTDDGAVGRLAIPRLGFTALVVPGGGAAARTIGHLANTALPGEWGNVVVAGNRDSLVQALRRVRVGDTITLSTLDGEFAYEVESSGGLVPGDTRALDPTRGRTLTVITGVPAATAGPGRDHLIVHARDLGTPRW
jgi:sortase A